MPLQNRVTPFGDIVALPERGLFTGNRGILHDPATRSLTSRRWTTKAWLICVLEFQDRRRTVMGGRSWTELFFLDEATALAAGHRPCFYCRRPDASAFRAAWAAGRGEPVPRAPAMDAVLHAERVERRAKRLHPLSAPISRLPDGAMVAQDDAAFLILDGAPLLWSSAGYRKPRHALNHRARLLTPPSVLGALAAGYRPALHPTALAPFS